jgi:hypothetical protein
MPPPGFELSTSCRQWRRAWAIGRAEGWRQMRKLTTVIGLVLILALGVVATLGRPQPARAATGDSVVLIWNQQLLDTIKETRTGPTIAARALAVVHTAIYDAWAAYDPVAVGTRPDLPRGRPPGALRAGPAPCAVN